MNRNELVLDKLIELGYLTVSEIGIVKYKNDLVCQYEDFDLGGYIESAVIFDGLVSECGKRDLEMTIKDGQMIIEHLFMDRDYIFAGKYARASVADAFMIVVGIAPEEVSDE